MSCEKMYVGQISKTKTLQIIVFGKTLIFRKSASMNPPNCSTISRLYVICYSTLSPCTHRESLLCAYADEQSVHVCMCVLRCDRD